MSIAGDTYFDIRHNTIMIYDGNQWNRGNPAAEVIQSRIIAGNPWYKILEATITQKEWILDTVGEDNYFSDPGTNGFWINEDTYTMMILAGLT